METPLNLLLLQRELGPAFPKPITFALSFCFDKLSTLLSIVFSMRQFIHCLFCCALGYPNAKRFRTQIMNMYLCRSLSMPVPLCLPSWWGSLFAGLRGLSADEVDLCMLCRPVGFTRYITRQSVGLSTNTGKWVLYTFVMIVIPVVTNPLWFVEHWRPWWFI